MSDDFWGYCCFDCGNRLKGRAWPEGHVATISPGICEICGGHKDTTHSRAWGKLRAEERKT